MTQAEVARRMGVSAPYVVAVEGGRANPTVGQLAAFADALQLGLELAFPPVPTEYGMSAHNPPTEASPGDGATA